MCIINMYYYYYYFDLAQLYRSDDDYLLLCTAESLEADIASPGCRVETGDLATVCRLCKLRSEDDNVMVHLISALNLIILGRGKFTLDLFFDLVHILFTNVAGDSG